MELIKIFNQTGTSILNIEEVIKKWNNMFSLIGWINETEEKYTFVVNELNEERPSTKTQITKEQALELIKRLNLIKEKSIMRSGCSWHTKKHYQSEIERLTNLIKERENDLEFAEAKEYAKEKIIYYLSLV
jgi:DNA-binding transcriptional MerR regulator